ncbi:arginine-tRNA-protein transferase [Nitrosomonas marina]|uniref:Aspartate/glutamate leucyltransferase n=2 Tax=Nitrosomonas marina TaxID=917 RepID=A0A1I0BCW3_9PROT|nr:arginyltransferase [Nitrosomonas marina]SET04344.1 arginine-tRNA-protein transferase [Nitrosomonas marina]
MNDPMKTLKYHTTHPYPCGYLPDKMARSEVVAPEYQIDATTYGRLLKQGYRRSGHFIYRPQCEHCRACLSVRIKVDSFIPSRSQRRSWKRHHCMTTQQHQLHYKKEHFLLYQRYQNARHVDGNLDHDKREQYRNFLLQSHVNSRLISFYDMERLRIISFIDLLPDGLSAVYTFYDPDVAQASYGTYSILWQIQQCRALGLPYLYLGYWIKKHEKMDYKANFQPLEILIGNQWMPFEHVIDDL